MITGLRMNHAYIRPGGVAQDLPDGRDREDPRVPRRSCRSGSPTYDGLLSGQPIWQQRDQGRRLLDVTGCLALGVTGPVLRSAGLAWDLRKTEPYCGYETYEFEVPTADDRRRAGAATWSGSPRCGESLKIVEQALDRLEPGPVMVEDKKIAWPAQLALGADGMGNSLDHVAKIMGQSMEALIHHFKLVTEGFRVPAGQVYVADRVARAASSACTWSATAAPGRTGCTCATRASSTCRPSRRWPRAA